MFDVRKPTQKQIVVIRAATGNELSNYEKRKLMNIENNAQENKIEVIKVNDKKLQIDPINKEVRIDLGDLASKDAITSKEISADDLFFISCSLDSAQSGTIVTPNPTPMPGQNPDQEQIPDIDNSTAEDLTPSVSEELLAMIGLLKNDIDTLKKIDYSAYATKDALANLAEEIPDVNIEDYYTKSETASAIGSALSNIEIPSKVSELENDSGYLTEQQDLSEYVKLEELPSLEGLASEDYVDKQIEAIQFPEPDLTNYYTKSETDTAIKEAVIDQEDDFGSLAFKSEITPKDLSNDEFIIKCEVTD